MWLPSHFMAPLRTQQAGCSREPFLRQSQIKATVWPAQWGYMRTHQDSELPLSPQGQVASPEGGSHV